MNFVGCCLRSFGDAAEAREAEEVHGPHYHGGLLVGDDEMRVCIGSSLTGDLMISACFAIAFAAPATTWVN